MQEFVIERHIPGVHLLTEEQVREGSLKSLEALRELGPEIQWLRSYITEDKIYCVYLAPDEALIRAHARKVGVPRRSRLRSAADD